MNELAPVFVLPASSATEPAEILRLTRPASAIPVNILKVKVFLSADALQTPPHPPRKKEALDDKLTSACCRSHGSLEVIVKATVLLDVIPPF